MRAVAIAVFGIVFSTFTSTAEAQDIPPPEADATQQVPEGGEQPPPYGAPHFPAYYGAPQPPGQPPTQQADEDPGANRVRLSIAPGVIGFAGSLEVLEPYYGGLTVNADPTVGAGLALDRAIGRVFAIGAGARAVFYREEGRTERSKGFDLFVLPRLRHGFGTIDVYLAVPVGLALDWPAGIYDSTGLGWSIAPVFGMTAYVNRSVGFFAEIGALFRRTSITDSLYGLDFELTLRQGLATFGLAVMM